MLQSKLSSFQQISLAVDTVIYETKRVLVEIAGTDETVRPNAVRSHKTALRVHAITDDVAFQL